MDWNNFDFFDQWDEFEEQEEKVDRYEEDARGRVIELVAGLKVVTNRELQVRLEKEFFPWVVGRATTALLREKKLRSHGYRGRRRIGRGVPSRFFSLPNTPYAEIEEIIRKKREVSALVNNQLTGEAPAGYHAENIFLEALTGPLGFKLHGQNTSEFGGHRVKGKSNKQPPDLDFIIERDGVIYGVDVKNWIKYDTVSKNEIISKVSVALQLRVVPFIVARYVDKQTIFKEVIQKGGIVYIYETLFLPPYLSSLAEEAKNLLGYPILAIDSLPAYKLSRIEEIHNLYLSRYNQRG